MNKKKSVVYECIVVYICRMQNHFNLIPKKEVSNKVLGRLFHIPKQFRAEVLRELVDLGYLEPINRYVYKVLPVK